MFEGMDLVQVMSDYIVCMAKSCPGCDGTNRLLEKNQGVGVLLITDGHACTQGMVGERALVMAQDYIEAIWGTDLPNTFEELLRVYEENPADQRQSLERYFQRKVGRLNLSQIVKLREELQNL